MFSSKFDPREGDVGHYLCSCGKEHLAPHECMDARNVLAKVRYKNWKLVIHVENDIPQWLQWDLQNEWKSRKWQLSIHMTPSELVQTAFKAALTAEEHECRESFMYKGKAIFGPHFHIDALVELCEQGKLDVRVPRP